MKKIIIEIKKIPSKIYGGAFFFFLLLTIVVWGGGGILKKIEVGNVSALYNTINNIIPNIGDMWVLKFSSPLLALAMLLMWWIGKYYKENIVLIKHLSLGYDIADVDDQILEQFKIEEVEISQFNLMSKTSTYSDAIELQDKIAEKTSRMRQGRKLGYYGIAHIPLIFRLGYKIGDDNNIMLFHKRRNNKALFVELDYSGDYLQINYAELNESIESEELLVTIATSQPIKENELESLCYREKHYLKIESNKMGFDSILSYEQAEIMRSDIMQRVRQMCKKYEIKKIHLVIASSSAFTFFLAQAFSSQHDPEILVYNFLRGNYPWAINMHEDSHNAVFINSMEK